MTTRRMEAGPEACAVPGCGRPPRNRTAELCGMHYHRRYRHGDVQTTLLRMDGGPCEVEGCGSPVVGRGLCSAHYQRLRATGDPSGLRGLATGERNAAWKGDEVGYSAAHHRTTQVRGRAGDLACVDCGEPAQHWSYQHDSPRQRTDYASGLDYSPDPHDYDPRCVRCHKIYDHGGAE